MLGRVKIKDTGLSKNCEESDVLKNLRREACAVGADIINIVAEKRADVLSTCYRVNAELLKSKDSQYTEGLQSGYEYKSKNVDSRVREDKKRKRGMFI